MSLNPVDNLIAILRNELEAHGKLFRLLESQRSALLQREPESIIAASEQLEGHIQSIRIIQRDRSQRVAELSPSEEIHSSSILHCIDGLDTPERPLLEELVREINRLINESKKQLNRNQMLFRRASDIGREMMRAIHPAGKSPETYRRDGLPKQRAANRHMAAYVAKTA